MKCIFTNRTTGMTFFSMGTNPTIGTNGLSELTNRIRLCILDMTGLATDDVTSHTTESHRLNVKLTFFSTEKAPEDSYT